MQRHLNTTSYLKLAVCLIISLSHLDLPSIQADNEEITSSKIKDKKNVGNFSKALTVLSIALVGAGLSYHQQDQKSNETLSPPDENDNEGKKAHNEDKKTYNEEKRIVRVNKEKISLVIPVIFRQTIEALEVLKPEEVGTLQNGVQQQIDENKEQFLDNYLKRSYKIDINDGSYIGTAMMKFKDDIKDDNHLYVACLVRTQKFSDVNNADDIKNKINEDMEDKLNLELDDHVVVNQM